MATFNFTVEMTSIGRGYIRADNIEQAVERITNGQICDYGDIYDEYDSTIGDLIEIEED